MAATPMLMKLTASEELTPEERQIRKEKRMAETHRIRRELYEKSWAIEVALIWNSVFNDSGPGLGMRLGASVVTYAASLLVLWQLSQAVPRTLVEQFAVVASQLSAVIWRDASEALFSAIMPPGADEARWMLLVKHLAWAALIMLLGMGLLGFARRKLWQYDDGTVAISPEDPVAWYRKSALLVSIETASCASGYAAYVALTDFSSGQIWTFGGVFGGAVFGGAIIGQMHSQGLPSQSSRFLVFVKSVGYSCGFMLNMACKLGVRWLNPWFPRTFGSSVVTHGSVMQLAFMLTIGTTVVAVMRLRKMGTKSEDAYSRDVVILAFQVATAVSMKGVIQQVLDTFDQSEGVKLIEVVTAISLTLVYAGTCFMTAKIKHEEEEREEPKKGGA